MEMKDLEFSRPAIESSGHFHVAICETLPVKERLAEAWAII
jgi:hypothetical protein